MIENLLIVFLAIIILYCIKWFVLILLAPSIWAYGKYMEHRVACKTTNVSNMLISKMLCGGAFVVAIPFACLHVITRGGFDLWLSYRINLIPSHLVRETFLKLSGAKLSKKVVVYIMAKIRAPWLLKIGEGTIIGDNATLDARSGLEIGKNVNISSNVSIWTLQHDHRDSMFGYPKREMKVTVGDRVWLGCNVIVLPGVKIGEGAVCCGGCVVTKDVEPFSVVAGIPAKKVGERNKELQYEFDGKSCWFW